MTDDDGNEAFDQTLAQAITMPDLESAALGCLLLEPKLLPTCGLLPTHFSTDNRRLFDIFLSLGPDLDVVTAADVITRDPVLSVTHGMKRLAECMEVVPSAAALPTYVLALDARLKEQVRFDPNEPVTEWGIARRFACRHRDDFRYLPSEKSWLVWDGRSWRPDATRRTLHAMAELVRDVGRTSDDADFQAVCRKHEKSSAIKGALELAGTIPQLAVRPEDFDAKPDLLQFLNGVVELSTGRFRPARRDDLLRLRIPHEFDVAATCPRWERFLLEVCAERAELAAFLRRFCGYCLTTEIREHALLLAIGKGRNGKSVFVETLLYVLGKELADVAAPGLLMSSKYERHPTEILDLRGKRLVVASEVSKTGAFSEERVKWMTGGDRLKGRGMRQDFVEFDPTHKFILCANHLPAVKDPTDGFWRRVRVVPFDVSFKGREDKGLPMALRAEAPGILAWLVRAAAEWRTYGLGDPVVIQDATSTYRQREDILGRFLLTFAVDAELTLAQIFAAYKDWCDQNGEREPKGGKDLAQDLENNGWESRHTKHGNLWHRVGPPPAELFDGQVAGPTFQAPDDREPLYED